MDYIIPFHGAVGVLASPDLFYLSTAKWGSKSSMSLSSKVILDFDIVQ
jgi:hypothetical protein